MLPAFDTPSGLPLSMINLEKAEGVDDPNLRGLVSTAEVSTLQLEFKYLSYLTENPAYWDRSEKVGLFGLEINSLLLKNCIGYGNYQEGNDPLRPCSNTSEVGYLP